MRYRTLHLYDFLRVCSPLFARYCAECGGGRKADASVDVYRAITDAGLGFCIVADDGDEVRGFITCFLSKSPHLDYWAATNDLYYVVPEMRRTALPGRLFVLAEREARRRGAQVFDWRCPDGGALDKALAKRPEYRRFEITYEKEL